MQKLILIFLIAIMAAVIKVKLPSQKSVEKIIETSVGCLEEERPLLTMFYFFLEEKARPPKPSLCIAKFKNSKHH